MCVVFVHAGIHMDILFILIVLLSQAISDRTFKCIKIDKIKSKKM